MPARLQLEVKVINFLKDSAIDESRKETGDCCGLWNSSNSAPPDDRRRASTQRREAVLDLRAPHRPVSALQARTPVELGDKVFLAVSARASSRNTR